MYNDHKQQSIRGYSMDKNNNDQNNAPKTNTKVLKDFKEFGRITSENLNEYFDLDLMAAAVRNNIKRK
tara:strand:+ start:438 stop:641 length:204 start_codon:yes stop_codon:yes gene_type:complete